VPFLKGTNCTVLVGMKSGSLTVSEKVGIVFRATTLTAIQYYNLNKKEKPNVWSHSRSCPNSI